MLVREILSRNLRDRRAVARYAGLTGSPDESGTKRREKGLSKAGNARVRRGLIQLAWRFLQFPEIASPQPSGCANFELRSKRGQPRTPLCRRRAAPPRPGHPPDRPFSCGKMKGIRCLPERVWAAAQSRERIEQSVDLTVVEGQFLELQEPPGELDQATSHPRVASF